MTLLEAIQSLNILEREMIVNLQITWKPGLRHEVRALIDSWGTWPVPCEDRPPATPTDPAGSSDKRDEVTVTGYTRDPDWIWRIDASTPEEIEDQIRDLDKSRILGPLDIARFGGPNEQTAGEATGPGGMLEYPRWAIKPQRYPMHLRTRFATVAEAAEELKVTTMRIRHLLQQGRIRGARKIGREWLIPLPMEVTPGSRGPRPKHERKEEERSE